MTPQGLDQVLKFGTAGHRRIADAVRARLRLSENRMRERFEQMTKNEERFQAYMPESDYDALRRTKRENEGIPQYRTIEIPYSYAVLMTAHTYYTSVFLARDPVFQVSGRHGESEMKIKTVEAWLDYQKTVGEIALPLFLWLMDPGKYGYGVVGHYWDEKYHKVRKVTEEPVTFLGMPLPGGKTRKVERVERVPGYRGNRVYNVRPQDFFPDPRVSMKYLQRGEFCARYVEHSWFDIVSGEKAQKYFNVDVLRKQRADRDAGSNFVSREEMSSRVTSGLPDSTRTDWEDRVPAGFVKSYEVYIRLHPNQWGLGKEDECEIWVITVSSNGVVYGCEPLGEYSDAFPFDIIEQEPDGYSFQSRSLLEVAQPMSDVITWLINTHFYNVRATLNNQFVVDPSMVVMSDVTGPGPGKIIRLKPQAYGKDVKTFIHQLQTADVTRGHMGDVQMVAEFIQRALGVTDSVMGMLPSKSHTTATAVRTSTSFGVNRLKTNCEYFSTMGWGPLVQKLIQRSQQNMNFETYLKTVGDLSQFGDPTVQVNPDMIAGFYDFVPVDGTLPVDRFAQANLWQMLLGQMQKSPQLMMSYDIAKVFGWVAGLAGIKNIAQFKIVPDATMMQQMQAGNVIPLDAASKGMKGNLQEPKQIPGMGATG